MAYTRADGSYRPQGALRSVRSAIELERDARGSILGVARRTWQAIGLSVLATALVVTTAAGAQPKRIYVANKHCTGHAYRPSRISPECVVANGIYVTDLKYSTYGGSAAKATGLFSESCTGSCGPRFRDIPGHIQLKHVIRCEGRWFYGTYSFRYGTASGNGGSGGGDIGPSPRCPDYYGG